LSDLILQNYYMKQKTPAGMIETIQERWPGKPIFFSEFGIRRFTTPSLDNDLPELEEWYTGFRGKHTSVIGASLWTINDYRSGYAMTLEDENRAWGLVNVWRQKRRLYERQQRENSPVHDVAVDQIDLDEGTARVTILIKGPDDYPSYIMRDYRLQYELRDSQGRTLTEGSQDLPVLAPGDENWSGEITWEPASADVFDFEIRLLSPNGYTRHLKTIPFSVPEQPTITAAVEGEGAVRVHFEPGHGADEHRVRSVDGAGNTVETPWTIDPYIDVEGLVSRGGYQVQLIASNSNGESTPSVPVTVQPNGTILPPFIWAASFEGETLVVGYSGEMGDERYALRYGLQSDALDQEITTNARGMMTVDLERAEPVFIQIKRVNSGRESSWSIVEEVER
jgi:beta-galactosidase